jgi:dipeptidyl aminopeptidase/acylaminoacyl peptidase
MPASVNHDAFVEPELVHYAGPDGQQVPAYLFVPKNLDRSKSIRLWCGFTAMV